MFIRYTYKKILISLPEDIAILYRNSIKEQLGSIYLALMPLSCFLILVSASLTYTEQSTEHRMKAAFLYNSAAFTEWPDQHNRNSHLCIYGKDSFEKHLQLIRQKKINDCKIVLKLTKNINNLIGQLVIASLGEILNLFLLNKKTDYYRFQQSKHCFEKYCAEYDSKRGKNYIWSQYRQGKEKQFQTQISITTSRQ